MPGSRQRRQNAPLVCRRIVRLEGAHGSKLVRIIDLAASHIDPAHVGCPAHPATWGRHAGSHITPAVARRIVFLDDIGVTPSRDAPRAEPSADYVNFLANNSCGR